MLVRIATSVALICVLAISDTLCINRIVGGQETTIERRPYQASLQHHRETISHSCGATIISTKHLLSAAHCNPGGSLSTLYARVGSATYNAGGQTLKVNRFLRHPQFSLLNFDYDIALVYFDEGVEIILGWNVAIVPLTTDTDPEDGSVVTVTGWGATSESDVTLPINLREVDLPVVNQEVCKKTYSFLKDRHICFGGTPEGKLSPCFGDSGGPAVQNGIQYGLVSGGSSCEKPNVPVIFSRISAMRGWIRENTGV